VADGFVRRGDAERAAFAQTVARRPIAAGQPVVSGQLVRPGQRGFLAAVLKPGTRAVSVSIDAAAAVSGLVYPGDRVDVLLTFAAAADGPDDRGGTAPAGALSQATRTVLSGLRVVAVGQRLAPAEPGDRPGLDGRTITLQATPAQARRIALARDLGGITLVLHRLTASDGPDGAADSDMARAGDLLGTGGALPPDQTMRHTIRVIEGTQEREVEVDAQ
jgi:pilus assembly protein CpaB